MNMHFDRLNGGIRAGFGSFPVSSPSLCRHLRVAWVAWVVAAFLGAAPGAAAGDWPQWRHDARRSGATESVGPATESKLWEVAQPAPEPAYDHQYRMCADVTYAPVAADGLLFLPSNVADEVTALDLETGVLRWRHPAEGPVRMAPVCVGDLLCFACDDGYLYAVSARDGALRWKVRGAPESLPAGRMLVNGRMSSRWPARGAPVAHEGVVYFGAGIWPEEGVYVCAVEAATGAVLWRSDAMSYVEKGMSDHGQAYDMSLPPQGYLAWIDGRLAVPSGRTVAAWFDPRTGEMEPYTSFYVKHNPPRGTWYIAGIDRFAVQGGNWFGTRADAAPDLPPELADSRSALFWSKNPPDNELYVLRNRPFLNTDTVLLHNENRYTEPVLAGGVAYQSEFVDERSYLVPRGHTFVEVPVFDRIVARDLMRPRWTSVRHMHVAMGKRQVTMPRLEFPILWELDSPLRVLIKAGDKLYVGGTNSIASVAIPRAGEPPRIEWEAETNGAPVHALVADKKLVVVTDTGHVLCFGDGDGDGPPRGLAAGADEGFSTTAPEAGYSLVVGWEDGEGAESLAAGSGGRVIVVESDAARADAARRALAEKGRHGRVVQVLTGDLGAMGFAPYWADRVVLRGQGPEALAEAALAEALAVLRPGAGELRWLGGAERQERVGARMARLGGYTLAADGSDLVVRREQAPPGAADWTHEAGDAANRFASSDAHVKWPLGVLWYSGEIDRHFTPKAHFQHERHPYPLVVDGRMFVITGEIIHAIDIYTGRYLWRAEMPLTPYVKTRFFDSRKYGRPTERNAVAAPDLFYAIAGSAIHAYDTTTGKPRAVLEIPDSLRAAAQDEAHAPRKVQAHGHEDVVQPVPEWTEVRLWENLLVAMLGRNLAAVDRHSGALRWRRSGARETTTYAIGADSLIGFDFDLPRLLGGRQDGTGGLLFALDPRDGAIRWEREIDIPPPPKYEMDPSRPWIEPVLPLVAINAKHGLAILAANRNELRAFQVADGQFVWSVPSATQRDPLGVYSPVVTDDHLLVSQYGGAFGYLFDVRTGREAGPDTAIPQPRTCARAIGNNRLLVYRNAATELYDIDGNRMIGLNSVRSGCTTSFIPAGGVLAAPMLGHGCVCNYPMFASLALHHMPGLDEHRPAAVVESWRNRWVDVQAAATAVRGPDRAPEKGAEAPPTDVSAFRTRKASIEPVPGGALFRTATEKAGYAMRPSAGHLESATFEFAFRRAPARQGEKRHGNAFFVFGFGPAPEDWIECQIYYGGRSSLVISGQPVAPTEEKVQLAGGGEMKATVTYDGASGAVTLELGGHSVATRLKGSPRPVTHYGVGGANSDTVFGEILVR